MPTPKKCSSGNPATCRYHGKPNPRVVPGIYEVDGKLKPTKDLNPAEKNELVMRRHIHKNVGRLITELNTIRSDREYFVDEEPVKIKNRAGGLHINYNNYARVMYKDLKNSSGSSAPRTFGIVNLKTGVLKSAKNRDTPHPNGHEYHVESLSGFNALKDFLHKYKAEFL